VSDAPAAAPVLGSGRARDGIVPGDVPAARRERVLSCAGDAGVCPLWMSRRTAAAPRPSSCVGAEGAAGRALNATGSSPGVGVEAGWLRRVITGAGVATALGGGALEGRESLPEIGAGARFGRRTGSVTWSMPRAGKPVISSVSGVLRLRRLTSAWLPGRVMAGPVAVRAGPSSVTAGSRCDREIGIGFAISIFANPAESRICGLVCTAEGWRTWCT
jgi:hypothetical protein